jgi:hypothetical protein
MNTLIYGGVKYKKIRHAVMCKICNVTLEGPHYKVCTCGSVAIDKDRLIGSLEHMEDRSVYCAKVGSKTLWLPELTPQMGSLAEKVNTCVQLQ